MTTDPTEQLVQLFAEESRVRAFAAVALGAGSTGEVARTAALSPKETAAALRRLGGQGVVTPGADGRLTVNHALFREYARSAARRDGADRTADTAAPTGDEPTDLVLGTFVRDGRLVRLPARWTRKKLVLRHIAERTFAPGVEYPERTVDEKLRGWCGDGDAVDHVTLRRHLVDLGLLHRSDGVYRRPAQDARGTAADSA
ncbi:secreted protein [Streptomyces zinciresistens K42]|uniref:Secreted protein n=1 Tax=Streptomyces zinciresistens K42 TaxID=700597 RepID=G2GHC7_9ACTN|nr:DUF2087 domain-containing protein [Streptomyces zinciresistens]EGX57081.1 secreted protein [Streptomyces zinciresistens K42]